MKTIPVSLIVAGILTPVLSLAQPEKGPEAPPPCEGDGVRGPQRPFVDFWKSIDTDHDGFISKEEFDKMPRIQKLPEEKRLTLFNRLDKNADGKLARVELERIRNHHGGQGPPMRKLWELDVNKSGGVSFEEFKAGELLKKLPPERQDQLFKRLDTDHDGMITPKDRPQPPFKHDDGDPHRQRHEDGKPGVGRMEPRQIIRLLDKDGDAALSFEEFRVGPAVKNLSADQQQGRFEAMDRNHDLKITPDEFPPAAPHAEPKPPVGDLDRPESE